VSSDAWKMQAAAEESNRAASRMNAAAEEMKQAVRNMDGAIDRFQMLWERQICPDLCALVDRLEKLYERKDNG
jgi:hypothetical protein